MKLHENSERSTNKGIDDVSTSEIWNSEVFPDTSLD